MEIITSYPLAVFMCIITMICWGSWANTQKLVSGKDWPSQLFYWDYTIGVFLTTLVFAFTFGSFGTAGRSFIPDLLQASWGALSLTFIGGIIFNLANLLLVIAITIAGMAIAFPFAIGLALVLGVVLNYIPNPVGNPFVLFIGVACVVVAVVLTALAYKKLQSNQSDSSGSSSTLKGVIVALVCGILMGLFFKFVMASIGTPEGSTNYHHLVHHKLSPYTAAVIFGLAVFLSSFVWNTINMYKPITDTPCKYSEYFKKGSTYIHIVGILGGVIWCIGLMFSLLASSSAGPAISYGLGQSAPLIAAVWGVFIWKEFANAPKGTNKLIALMFVGYLLGLALIVLSKII